MFPKPISPPKPQYHHRTLLPPNSPLLRGHIGLRGGLCVPKSSRRSFHRQLSQAYSSLNSSNASPLATSSWPTPPPSNIACHTPSMPPPQKRQRVNSAIPSWPLSDTEKILFSEHGYFPETVERTHVVDGVEYKVTYARAKIEKIPK